MGHPWGQLGSYLPRPYPKFFLAYIFGYLQWSCNIPWWPFLLWILNLQNITPATGDNIKGIFSNTLFRKWLEDTRNFVEDRWRSAEAADSGVFPVLSRSYGYGHLDRDDMNKDTFHGFRWLTPQELAKIPDKNM